MLDVRLPRFNRWLRAPDLGDGFAMGIGLNSGHFMSGTSARRGVLEYTVYGDTVNTAARLEEMTKIGGRSILVAESTCQALLHPPDDLAFVGEFDIRGRQSTIRLWTLASSKARDHATDAREPKRA